MKEKLLLLKGIRTLINFRTLIISKIYKYMTLVSKNLYIYKLDGIVNKYNNTYRSPIKMKPLDVKSIAYIDLGTEKNDEDSNFKVDDLVRISKYKNIYSKGYVPN